MITNKISNKEQNNTKINTNSNANNSNLQATTSSMTLRELGIGKTATVKAVGGEGALRQHLLDMGVIPGAELSIIKFAPMGDPMEIKIHGYELTLRLADAEKIEVEMLCTQRAVKQAKQEKKTSSCTNCAGCGNAFLCGMAASSTQDGSQASLQAPQLTSNQVPCVSRGPVQPVGKCTVKGASIEHPGLGEGGRFHPKGTGNPLPESETLTFALVGNQNCGKTTLFNQLTGSNQHVGNFPGVTVDSKTGNIKGHPETLVADLPGIYSMSPYSAEEIVSRNFVINQRPNAIINIIDGTNIERNLYLTMQLLEMDIPMVISVNMMDEVIANGGSIDINRMECMLGVPVIPISAAKNQGIDELIDHAIHIARYQEKPEKRDFCDYEHGGGAVHRGIHAVIHLIHDHANNAGIPVRFAATKVIEGDQLVTNDLMLDRNELETIGHIVLQMEDERGLDKNAAIADMRFAFISKVCTITVRRPHESSERIRSEKLDRILTGKYTAIPAFIAIMGIVFYLTFNVIGAWLQELLALGIGYVGAKVDMLLVSADVNEALRGLIVDGIFEGVGSIVSFMPIIVTMFFFLSILEDSGYIARVAFVMDKLLRKIGLSGRSIVPMLIGFGCTVPAVMATRTLPSERDRKMTILITPFMSCSAKLPVYGFFVSAFFPGKGGLIMTALYVLGIVVAILIALLYRGIYFKGDTVPFVMELPNYRLPGARNVVMLLWDKAKDFLQRAFTVILVATVIIWILQSFDTGFHYVTNQQDSMLAMISGIISPIMAPLGLGDWRICTALFTGFIAKESVVSTLQLLFGAGVSTVISKVAAISLMVFSLLYTPCVAAVAAVRREMGRRWAVFVVIWQCAVAWVASYIAYLIAAAIL